MTTNSMLVLNYLKENYGQEFSKQELADKLGISLASVVGSINGLDKKHYVTITREETVVDSPATETRKERSHVVKYHTLTEAGLSYDPIAEEEAKKAAKEAEKARRAAEKAAAKGE